MNFWILPVWLLLTMPQKNICEYTEPNTEVDSHLDFNGMLLM